MKNIPKTYEEFLKLPYDELIEIAYSEKTIEEAQIFISYMDRADKEFGSKVISEEKKKNGKSLWEMYCEK